MSINHYVALLDCLPLAKKKCGLEAPIGKKEHDVPRIINLALTCRANVRRLQFEICEQCDEL
jgi:hypothetical protein